MSDSAAPKRRAFACSIALFMGRSGSYRQNLRFCTLTKPHPTISTLFYISIHCHVSIFVGDPFTRGRLRCIGLLYCVLAGALEWGCFIDRFEWGEVCICTLCAVKYKGGVSNGMWDAKSDVVHKTRTPQTYGDADDQCDRRNGDVTGVGYSAAMNPTEQWTPNGSNRNAAGCIALKVAFTKDRAAGCCRARRGKRTKNRIFCATGRKTRGRALARDTLLRQANNFIRRVTVARRNIAAIATRDTMYAAVFSLLARRL